MISFTIQTIMFAKHFYLQTHNLLLHFKKEKLVVFLQRIVLFVKDVLREKKRGEREREKIKKLKVNMDGDWRQTYRFLFMIYYTHIPNRRNFFCSMKSNRKFTLCKIHFLAKLVWNFEYASTWRKSYWNNPCLHRQFGKVWHSRIENRPINLIMI